MSKGEAIVMTGKVVEILPDSKVRILLDTGHSVLGYLSGRMIKNRIQVMAGDYVSVELTPYDLTRGRIVRRLNQEKKG